MRKTTWCVLAVTFALTPCLAQADAVDTVWMRRFAQPGYCNDEATAMFADAAGNVYVTGSSQVVEAGQKDYAIVKYSPTGVQLWANRYSGIGNSIPSAIAVDGSGNVYVTGASDSARTYSDILTVKYNAAGVLQWADRYTSPGDCIDAGRAVCVDGSGNVAVCGVTSSVSTSYDWVVIGYTPDGARRFVTPRTSAGGNPDEANGIVADPQGNYYVAGRLWFPNHVDDAVVTKYDSSGAEQWTASYDGPLSGDGAVAICRSAAGDLYATGWSVGLQDNADVLTMKVSAAGALVWTARYAAPENGSDMGLRITVDDEGNPRVLGRVQVGSGGDYDLVTLGYRADSAAQFANRLGASSCAPGGIALDKDGHVTTTARPSRGAGSRTTVRATVRQRSAWTTRTTCTSPAAATSERMRGTLSPSSTTRTRASRKLRTVDRERRTQPRPSSATRCGCRQPQATSRKPQVCSTSLAAPSCRSGRAPTPYRASRPVSTSCARSPAAQPTGGR
jgi:hypothetical protein